jgi:glycerophosphoryl diester phosphodiesterase
LQAHRGGRGLAPENTLAAFRNAMEMGIITMEADLGITADEIVVVSHDLRLNPDLVRDTDGAWIEPPGHRLIGLTLDELKRFDIGRLNPQTKYGQRLPDQKAIDGERFPTLAELYALGGPTRRYSLETKIDPTQPEETVSPQEFARLVVDAVRKAGMEKRTMIQSFDWRTLVEVKKLAPEIETSCLTMDTRRLNTTGPRPSPWLAGFDVAPGGSIQQQAKAAGCSIWSPLWINIDAAKVAEAHQLGLKVIPWTVNAPSDMKMLIGLKVDGLITDYPDRGLKVVKELGLKLD